MSSIETSVAEINDGRSSPFARSMRHAWLDIHGPVRRMLERLQTDSRAIWDGCSAIVARKDVGESATWI
jgi:hypothetical protein